MAGRMYFGNRNFMQWVKCPDTGMGMGRVKWSAEGTYLNGGGYVRESTASHQVHNMAWNFMTHEQVRQITDYRDGVYGDELVHFLDPFAMNRNVLPQNWAVPALAGQDGQPLTDTRPTTRLMGVTRTNYVLNPKPIGPASGSSIPRFAGYLPGTGESGVTMTSDVPLETAIVATNLVPNPQPVETPWASGPSAVTSAQIVSDEGASCLEVTITESAASSPYVYVLQSGAATPGVGRWVAFGVDVKPLTAQAASSMRTLIRLQNGTTTTQQQFSSPPPGGWVAGQWSRSVVSVQQTSEADNVDALTWPTGAQALGPLYRARRAVVVFADTKEAAEAAVATYFDGDTPPQDAPGDVRYVHGWSGTANGSISTKALSVTQGATGPHGRSFARRVITAPKTGGSTGWSSTSAPLRHPLSGVAGDTVNSSVWLRYVGPTPIRIRLRSQAFLSNGTSPGGFSDSDFYNLPSGEWVRLNSSHTATANFDQWGWWAYLIGATSSDQVLPAGSVLDVAGGLVEKTATVKDWFDGDVPDIGKVNNEWTGPTNASTSTQTTAINPYAALGAPNRQAVYTLTADTEFKEVWVPVPDGYSFHIGGLYTRTGTANVIVETDIGNVVQLTPDSGTTPHLIPSTIVSNTGGGVTVRLSGVGTITLVGLMAQVLPNGHTPTTDTFISGQGTSGCRFTGEAAVSGYSAVRDHLALSVTLKEVGAWDE